MGRNFFFFTEYDKALLFSVASIHTVNPYI